jgi:ABC-type multidrug transport system ATPase subunit
MSKKKKRGKAKAALEVRGLYKAYGRNQALNGLDLTIPEGTICGFIGPNGAGKTTTFGILGGLIAADGGEIDILGKGPFVARRDSGVLTMLPQDCDLSPHVPVVEYLRYLARLQGMTKAEAAKTADARLDEVALKDRARAKLKELSHGMRRRVAVAQALLGDPKVVLLDEPTSGLDPELVVRMREVFEKQRGKRTLVISSHNLRELEEVCDHVVFIQLGQCIQAGSIEEVTQRSLLMRYLVEHPFDLAAVAAKLTDLTFQGAGQELIVEAPDGWTASKINAAVVPHLLEAGAGLLEIRQGQSLEDAYMAGQQQQ